MLKKSPSGCLCPYYYKGGELHPLHYGSYHSDADAFFAIVAAEEAFILASHGGRKIWVDLYETDLTEPVCEQLAEHFQRIGHKTSQLALVGCGWRARRTLRRLLRGREPQLFPTFFSDPEKAKDWLVGIGR